MRFWQLNIILVCFVFGLVGAQAPANMTISLDAMGACNSTSSFHVGDSCQFRLTIMVPANTPTTMVIEIDSSDNSSTVVAQICRPTISWGANYNITNAPYPQMVSSFGTSQFDTVTIDFGVIQNSGSNNAAAANSIVILFTAVIISNGQTDGQTMWVTTSVDYYSDTEIWVGQGGLTFATDSISQSLTGIAFNSSTSTGSVQVGSFNTFLATLLIIDSRYHSLSITANSSALSNNPIRVCSVHIHSAGSCYSCLDSVKANVYSAFAKDSNTATLNLGYVPNMGINSVTNTAATAYINVFVTYRSIESATVGTTSPITPITLTATIANATSTTTATFVHTPTVIALGSLTVAPTPNISALVSSTPVSIYQSFNISMLIQLPQTFNNFFQVDVIPTQGTTDGSPRVKVCSVVSTYTGENVPCPKCVNSGLLEPYSQNTSVANTYDSFTYSINNVMNYNLRTVADDPNVNNLTISIIGQVLNHSLNTYGSNISIPIGITFGNQTIWIGEGYVIVGGSANFSNNQNSSLPTFSMSVADNLGYTANVGQPRAFFLDIYTQPGSVYEPMNVEFVMPETVLGNGVPAATICSVQMYYVGVYSVCAQSAYVNNFQISYLARMVQFKNDKAIVTLNSLCNSANSSQTMDPIDGLVRFLVYFSLSNDSTLTTQNYIGAAVDLDPNTVYVGQLLFTNGNILPQSSMTAGSLYGYQNTAASNTTVTGRSFATIDYVIKIPPQSLYGYNIQTSLTKSLSAGDAAICTVQITQSGKNVPCAISLTHNYVYSSNYLKSSDYAFSTPICSINNLTTAVTQTSTWDDDSVNLVIITRPNSAAVGTYTVNLAIFDGYTNTSDFSSNPSFTVTTSAFGGSVPNAQTSLMNSTVYSVDPANSSSLVFAYANFGYLYKGQTSIIRFNMTLLDYQYYDVEMNFESSLTQDNFQIVRFFISNIGLNFPCASMVAPVTFSNGTYYPYAASLNMGEVAYYPIAPLNLSSSTITFEAHVRIPWSSSLSSSGTFTFTPTFNSVTASSLAKTTSSLPITSALSGFNSTIQTGITFVAVSSTTAQLYIKQSYSVGFTLTIPPFSNLRTILNVSCQDPTTGRIACLITSLSITSMGRNVDGLWGEYQYGQMEPYYFRNSTSDNFYNDTAVFDLGIITNTAYGLKLGNYVPTVDDVISISCNVLVTDDLIANNSNTFPVKAALNFNSGTQYASALQNFQIKRNGTEVPSLSLSTSFLNATNVAFGSLSYVLMQFTLSHLPNSSAEAYNASVVFYFPPYVTLNSVVFTNATIVTGNSDSAVFFNISRVHFTENIVCTFSVTIDGNSQYETYINNFGQQPPSMLSIPYNMYYYKYPRYSPTTDSTLIFAHQMNTVKYTPATISSTLSIPMTPIIANSLGAQMSSGSQCVVTSSVTQAAALGLTTTSSSITWTSNYRSIYWYSSAGTYVQIAFGSTTSVSAIQLSQLGSGSYVPFTSFQVSFSDDGGAFAYLPVANPTSTALGSAAFNYTIPNGYITCSYLRVHIIGVTTPASLLNTPTGLIISEIYGAPPASYPTCSTSSTGAYTPQSYLYVPTLTKLFLCDENFNRTRSECFSSSDSSPTTWLVMPKVVTTIVFWVRDTNPNTNVVSDYLYGLAADKVSYMRSDDLGFSWIAVSNTEFNTMQSSSASRYTRVNYSAYTPGTSTTIGSSSWSVGPNGFSYGGTQTFDWFN